MLQCPHCAFKTDIDEKLAGHISGHVRRGEVLKRTYNKKHICECCNREFATGNELGGHKRWHVNSDARSKLTFETLKSSGQRRQWLLTHEKHQCVICMNVTWQNQPIPLEVDHVDGNTDNNARENLRLVCPNCHAQTDTYKGKNAGKHYTERREYFKRYYKALILAKQEHASVTQNS